MSLEKYKFYEQEAELLINTFFKFVVTSQFYKMMHVFFSNTNKTVKNKMLLDKFK